MCYERFDGRLLANVDPTGKVRIGVPRAWRNCHSYGINRNDADYLRWEMMGRCLPELEHISLFCLYGNRWHLDLHAYPTEADAFRYWEDFPVTASTLAGFELVRKQVRE